MFKKHVFLQFFSKIALFACVFCAFFISPVFATLPAGYTELEYIESTGIQYIDTGIYADLNTKIDIDFSEQGSSGVNPAVFGSAESGDNSRSFFMAKNSAGTNWYANFDSIARTVIKNPTIDKSRHNVVLSKNGWYYDNELRATWSNPTTWIQTNSIWLFARSVVSGGATNPSKTRIYFAKLYQSDLLFRDLIPAKRTSDSVIGMYDMVSNTFFTNAGTGEFIAGPEVVIKIATTKYVDDEFAPLDTALANAISVVDNVVTQTIAQAGQIATLQNTKQTRPDDDDECPAGKKCLLVTDETGTPHWYPIIEP